jgi:hypothetical protein
MPHGVGLVKTLLGTKALGRAPKLFCVPASIISGMEFHNIAV